MTPVIVEFEDIRQMTAALQNGQVDGILYSLMYGLVLPWRFGTAFPDPDRLRTALTLFPHVALVGIPVFWLVRRKPPLS